jgi:hypothetical protein
MKRHVSDLLDDDDDYPDDQLDEGFEYADEIGYEDESRYGSLTSSSIRYGDNQLADGELFDWEPEEDW